jgi:2-dehydro-3-deoxygluconokinase
MKNTFDLVSIGEPLVGMYPADEESKLFRAVYGGDTSNVALAAARLGVKTGFAGAIGNDPWGFGFSKLWKRRGVDTSLVVNDPDRFTGMYVISFDEGEHRFAYYRQGSAASQYNPDKALRKAITSAKVLHVSGISQAISLHLTDLLFDLLEEAHKGGTLISYDINYRPALWSPQRAGAIAERTITQFADIVTTNVDEFVRLGLGNTRDEFVRKFGDHVNVIAIRDGERGAYICTKDGELHSPAFNVDVADTVGAGDAFDAGLLVAYLNGCKSEECLERANAVAAHTCTKTGPTDGQPDNDEVSTLVKTGKRRTNT